MNLRKAPPCGPAAAFVPLLPLLLVACAARPAPGIDGRWTPVNRYQAQTHEIPLRPAHVFFATPMDRTLKGMLERWARDASMKLAYEHPSDFVLHAPVADLRSDDLHNALARLNGIYAAQQVAIGVQDDRIVVRRGAGGGTP